MLASTDYAALARSMSRHRFVESHPYLFVSWQLAEDIRAPHVLWCLRTQELGILWRPDPETSEILPHHAVALQDNHRPQPGRVTIGRAPNNDIVIQDVSVSARHAHFLLVARNNLWVQDVASRNGTWVAGRRLMGDEAASVNAGDQVRLGRVVLELLGPAACFDRLTAQPTVGGL